MQEIMLIYCTSEYPNTLLVFEYLRTYVTERISELFEYLFQSLIYSSSLHGITVILTGTMILELNNNRQL